MDTHTPTHPHRKLGAILFGRWKLVLANNPVTINQCRERTEVCWGRRKKKMSEHKSPLMNREQWLLKCCNKTLSLELVYRQRAHLAKREIWKCIMETQERCTPCTATSATWHCKCREDNEMRLQSVLQKPLRSHPKNINFVWMNWEEWRCCRLLKGSEQITLGAPSGAATGQHILV